MAESTPVATLNHPAGHPDALLPPGVAISEEMTVADQAAILHSEIYGIENGVPSEDTYRAAQEFASHVTFDQTQPYRDAQGTERSGTYRTADGEQLDYATVQDIVYAAQPRNWVQTSSNRDVLEHARDILHSNEDNAANLPVLEHAQALASRMGENVENINDKTLQRMLDMDAVARADLAREKGGSQLIEGAASYSEEQANKANPAGTVRVTVPHEFVNTAEAAPQQPVRPDELTNVTTTEQGKVTARVSVSAEYAQRETIDTSDPAATLERLIANDDVRSAEDIARLAYPEKVIGSGRRNWRQELDPGEIATVERFAAPVEAARRFEANVPEQFRRQNPLPTHQEVAHELFPDVEQLTPAHWRVVNQTMGRLQAARLEQVRPDRLTNAADTAARAGERVKGAAQKVGEIATTVPERSAGLRARWNELKSRARGRVVAAGEEVKPENVRVRVGRFVGAAANAAARVVENRPWEHVMPAMRNLDPRQVARVIGVKLQTMAAASGENLRNYLSTRLAAAKQAETSEYVWKTAYVAAGLAFAGAVAVRTYLQYRHNIDTGHGTGAGSLLDHANAGSPSNGSHNQALDNAHNLSGSSGTNAAHETVQVGSYDANVKILGYSKGTVGYRVLEHARASGFDVKDATHADRLIDATIKMDDMSWSDKVGADQSVKLLSYDQIAELLKK